MSDKIVRGTQIVGFETDMGVLCLSCRVAYPRPARRYIHIDDNAEWCSLCRHKCHRRAKDTLTSIAHAIFRLQHHLP